MHLIDLMHIAGRVLTFAAEWTLAGAFVALAIGQVINRADRREAEHRCRCAACGRPICGCTDAQYQGVIPTPGRN